MTTFHKPSLQPADHINILQRRGLNVPDIAKAERYLRTIGYYRLSADCLPFQSNKDVLADETSFEDILSLYIFDRKLRFLVPYSRTSVIKKKKSGESIEIKNLK